ncbi:MAG: hydantoinase/oxoprolinase family protein [Nitrospinota bacterium]
MSNRPKGEVRPNQAGVPEEVPSGRSRGPDSGWAMDTVLAVDSGGTFTDCVLIDGNGRVSYDKAFSDPQDMQGSVLSAVRNVAAIAGKGLGDLLSEARVLGHGTTVAINAYYTGRRAKTGLITTKGHEDVILIGRVFQKVAGLVEREITVAHQLRKPSPLVPRPLIKGVTERVDFRGEVIAPLRLSEVRQAVQELLEEGVEAIAVSFLWSFKNRSHERLARSVIEEMAPDVFVTLSSDLAPVINEYERTITTVLNANLGPVLSRYLGALQEKLREMSFRGSILVMQSTGGALPAAEAREVAIQILNSGPIGGVLGAVVLSRIKGWKNLIATDIGGTSFDVSLVVDGESLPAATPIFDRYHLALPLTDISSIGAGGGSVARVERDARLLQVGPDSAGAFPGPACYGWGGAEPTVTDADVLLGRINPENFFGGRHRLDLQAARRAIEDRVAKPLGMDVFEAAQAILDVIDARMADLVRKVTVERGHDPRDFVLLSYGGSGPTHVGAYGRDLGCPFAVISPYSPVFSAFGIGSADILRTYVQSDPKRMPCPAGEIDTLFAALEERARKEFQGMGLDSDALSLLRSVTMKFRRQVHELLVPVPGGKLREENVSAIQERFRHLYEQTYGKGTAYEEAGVEMGTFRLTAVGHLPKPTPQAFPPKGPDPRGALKGERKVYFNASHGFLDTDVYDAERLEPGNEIEGPAVAEGAALSLPIHPGQRVRVDEYKNLLLSF